MSAAGQSLSDYRIKPYATCTSSCGERVTEVNDGSGGGSGRYPGNSNGTGYQTLGATIQ
ncbi:hypothetical protein [Xanthomonas fragariae]|uniref:hypothetical protein n=1 Tax=Xanthomonas fragariae TaxID=48664 RepID=UPI001ABDC732|nr:hypothetical protein [Xanthomonas fragariae]UKR54286.1 hypothetical protein K4A87_01795 [Xanthomonas fragariae]